MFWTDCYHIESNERLVKKLAYCKLGFNLLVSILNRHIYSSVVALQFELHVSSTPTLKVNEIIAINQICSFALVINRFELFLLVTVIFRNGSWSGSVRLDAIERVCLLILAEVLTGFDCLLVPSRYVPSSSIEQIMLGPEYPQLTCANTLQMHQCFQRLCLLVPLPTPSIVSTR